MAFTISQNTAWGGSGSPNLFNKKGSLNPVSSSKTGGFIKSDNVIIQIASWADALEPRRTPILSKIKKGKAVDQIKLEWGQSYHTPVSGTVNEALTNSDLTITLTSGEAKFIQKWMVLEIIDYVPGTTRLDYTTREQVLVTDDPTSDNDITVRRAFGGTARTHNNGAYWAVCGVAMPYNENFTLSPFTRGDRIYNVPQRFFGMVGADVAARNTPNYEYSGDQMLADMKTETLRQKYFLERALISGTLYDSNDASVPNAMGGIKHYITTASPHNYDLGGKTLSAYDFEDIFRTMFKEIDDGGAKTVLMGPDTAALWDTMLNPYRQATTKDSSVNLMTDSMKFRWGTVNIEPTIHLPEGEILIVDFSDISLHPYKGCDWQTKTLATDGPYDKMALWGDFTLKVERPTRMARMYNFNTDPGAYPRREFF